MHSLPDNWSLVRLGDIAQVNPKFDPDDIATNLDVSFVPMKAVEERTGRIDLHIEKRLAEVQRGYTPIKDGDIIFAKITPCMENGKVAIANNLKNGVGFGSTEFHVIRVGTMINRKLLFYFLLQDDYRHKAQRNMTGSAGQLRVPKSFIEDTMFPCPPSSEQNRIVAKIEELFSDLDAGVEALKKVKAQLVRYRQSVLKAAFEGKLTEEWREANRGSVEPASALLFRLEEARGKKPTNAAETAAGPDLSGLPELPEGWCWTTFERLLIELRNGFFAGAPASQPPGIPILRINAVRPLSVNFDAPRYLANIESGKLHDYFLKDGDLLFTRYNGSIELLGACGLVRRPKDQVVYPDKLIRVRVPSKEVIPDYLEIYFATPLPRRMIELRAKSTAGQKGISGADLKRIPVALAPYAEQLQIIEEVHRRLSLTDEAERTVEQSLKHAERLRQSILKKAFEGKLVPQDPNDEPAEKLLERIKEEKKKIDANGKAKKGAKRQEAAFHLELI